MRTSQHVRNAAIALLAAGLSFGQKIEFATVVSKAPRRTVSLPGEFRPWLTVSLHARVAGFVETVLVDVGSRVKTAQTLIEIAAPEMASQIAEAESKLHAATADRAQAEAQVSAAQSTYDRLKQAAETPGAIAGNELVLAEKQLDSAKAVVLSREGAIQAAKASVQALKDLEAYLKVSAPFDGVITERLVHPGALVGPSAGSPLLTLEQISRLRLVVPVPEEDAAGIVNGAAVTFAVPAWPERTFSGRIARISRSLDPKTRTMAVELDVLNPGDALAPGMFPTVKWPVGHARPSLFVPKSSVVTTSERTFVIRDRDGYAEWVNVKKGASDGDLIEVSGKIAAGDRVVRRATDEIRDAAPLAR